MLRGTGHRLLILCSWEDKLDLAGSIGSLQQLLPPVGWLPLRLQSAPVQTVDIEYVSSLHSPFAGCLLQDPHHLYTFCPEFHHSMTLSKSTVKEARKEAARKSREQWRTSFGWQNRGCMDSMHLNRHPLHPHPSRIEELTIVSNTKCLKSL